MYFEITEFITLPQGQHMYNRARKIYQRFLMKDSREPVQISSDILSQIESLLMKNIASPRMFDAARKEVKKENNPDLQYNA